MSKPECPFCYIDCIDWKTCERLRCNHDQQYCEKGLYCSLNTGTRIQCNKMFCQKRLQEYVELNYQKKINNKLKKIQNFFKSL